MNEWTFFSRLLTTKVVKVVIKLWTKVSQDPISPLLGFLGFLGCETPATSMDFYGFSDIGLLRASSTEVLL